MEAAYLALAALAREGLAVCRLCGHACGVDRSKVLGYCRTGTMARVASWGPHLGEGRDMAPAELVRVMIALQSQGCHNVNLVSPTHVPAFPRSP